MSSETQKRLKSDFYVEGYATTYEKYMLMEYPDGSKLYERFERGCFDNADMSDVIMQYDHCGRVFARMSNNTLIVEPDENGLFIAADLSLTEGAKELYGEISAELITRMSWGFLPGDQAAGDWYYDPAESCIVHRRIKKIYDVSAVSIPANDGTSIYTRNADFTGGEICKAAEEFRTAQLEVRRKRVIIRSTI